MMPSDPRPTESAGPQRGWAFKLAALGLILVCGLAGTGLARWLRPGVPAVRPTGLKMPARLFAGWPRPDLAIVLSGSQHGYLLPCGCSRPQVGGLERRYNFIQLLREMGWPVVAVDVGDIPQVKGPLGLPNQQGLLKYRYSMLALREMGYSAVGFGEYEAAPGLLTTLAEFALNDRTPAILGANLKDRLTHYPRQQNESMVGDWLPVKTPGSSVHVGVTAVVGPLVGERVERRDPDVKFLLTQDTLNAALAAMTKSGIDFRVLLYQGLPNAGRPGQPPTEAMRCAQEYPQFQVVLCVGESDEPPAQPERVGNAFLCQLGHKGKYVGVVGVWRTKDPDKPFHLAYQLVSMSEEFLTPEDRESDHPVAELMERYTQELERDNYLARYGQTKHPLQILEPVEGLRPGTDTIPKFIGSEACKRCHDSAYDVWKSSAHSHAYDTLVKAQRPSLRQFDAECIVCHTVGFSYESGFRNAKDTPHLMNVGCESCHGPGSIHARNPSNLTWRARMNPWQVPENETPEGKRKRLARIDQFCQRCHDIDNDVTWTNNGFEKKWPGIAHPTIPPDDAAAP